MDWYNAFVVHPELLFWAIHDGDRDPDRAERIFDRARAYLHHYPYFFAADGAHVAFGRSLTYRSAVLAPLHLAVLADASPLSPGLARRLGSGNLAYHLDRGMLNENNVITVGFEGERPDVRDPYISAGSVYFAARRLTALALPRDHAFWTAPEEPLPADGPGSFSHALPGPRLAPFSEASGAPVNMWNGPNSSPATAYIRISFSTHFAFNRRGAGEEIAYDAAVTVTPDGRTGKSNGMAANIPGHRPVPMLGLCLLLGPAGCEAPCASEAIAVDPDAPIGDEGVSVDDVVAEYASLSLSTDFYWDENKPAWSDPSLAEQVLARDSLHRPGEGRSSLAIRSSAADLRRWRFSRGIRRSGSNSVPDGRSKFDIDVELDPWIVTRARGRRLRARVARRLRPCDAGGGGRLPLRMPGVRKLLGPPHRKRSGTPGCRSRRSHARARSRRRRR